MNDGPIPAGAVCGRSPRRAPCRTRTDRRRGDHGVSFVELLVSIVLIGTAVISTVVGLRATIVASGVNDDRARMVAWLQHGVDAVHRTPYVSCTSGIPAVDAAYQGALDAVPVPAGWSGGSLQLTDIRFESVDSTRHVEQWTASCDPDRPAQLLSIEVASPGATMVETVGMVRDG